MNRIHGFWEKIRQMIKERHDERQYSLFCHYLKEFRENELKAGRGAKTSDKAKKYRERAFKCWGKMNDEHKTKFLLDYSYIAYARIHENVIMGSPDYCLYTREFAEQLISKLWRASSFMVQRGVYNAKPKMKVTSAFIIGIATIIIEKNWEQTAPELQRIVINDIMNATGDDMRIVASITPTEEAEPIKISEQKVKKILEKIKGMNHTVLLEMWDSIMQFLDNEYVTDESLKGLAETLPENVKKEKIETTFDYSVRDDKLFAKKWETLSYEEKIASVKEIFSKSIYEGVLGSRAMEDTNIIRRMYPYYYRVKDNQLSLIGENFISYDSRVIKRIIGDIRGDDLDKCVGDIIGQKQDNPFTIYYIWNSLDRRAQIKYYDQVMELLEEYPKSQYELWNATQTNSENQRKKQTDALLQVQTLDDIKKLKVKMKFLLKGVTGGESTAPKATDEKAQSVAQEEERD